MNFNRKEHSRFIQYLDKTAEKNPLLWLPCVLLIALILTAEHIAEYAKIAYSHRNTEKVVREKPQLEKKPFFLRAVAVTVTAAFSLMLVPVNSFAAFDEEYDPITEQVVFDNASETEEIIEPEVTTVPEETTEPEEVTEPEETTAPEDISEPEETTAPEDISEPEETTASEETNEPEETTVPEEITDPEETDAPEETTEPEETIEPEETTVPEEEFPEEEIVNEEEIDLLADHVHTFHRWEQTEYEHWRVCTECNRELDRSSHDFAIKVTNPTQSSAGRKTFTCTVCGYSYYKTLPPVSHDHEFTTRWNSDTDSHWHVCVNPDCEAIGDFAAHTFGEWRISGIYHYKVCSVCSRNIGYTLHDYKLKNNADGHYYECLDCGHKISEEAHNFVVKYDESKHWQECSVCDYKMGEAAHSLSGDWLYTDTTHRQGGCTECGYSTSSTDPHDFSWNTNDDGEHWQSCSTCGWESDKVPHNPLWKYDDFGEYGKHWQECVCGYETDWEEHNFNDWAYKSDGNDHWYECTGCGLRVYEDEHDCEWEYVDDEHWRLCKVCGDKLDVGEHAYKPEHDDKEHWAECVCGKKQSIEAHKFSDGVFTLDEGDGYDPDDEDGEDGRTPVKRYYCTVCGYYYNEPITHTHTAGTKWEHDGSDHWHECTSCGKRVDTANHDYSVKVTLEPTETKEGTRVYTCKVCGYSYEETIPELGHVHAFGTEWSKNETDHWHECVCGERTDIAPHVPDVNSNTCIICGYIIKTVPSPSYPGAVTEVSLRLPYVTNDTEVKGWLNISAYINASPDGAVIPITMNGENELPREIAECIMDREITLRIRMNEGPVWTLNGRDVLYPETVNMRVSEQSNRIPSSVVDGIVSEFKPKEYRLYHSGDFGFLAELTLNVGSRYNGYYAVLYHYNTGTKQLEFVDESLVEERFVTFELTHASYYAVAFNSFPMYDNVSSHAGVFENSIPIETSAMPETGGVTVPAVKLPQIMKYSNKKRRYRVLKKRRLDDLVFVL